MNLLYLEPSLFHSASEEVYSTQLSIAESGMHSLKSITPQRFSLIPPTSCKMDTGVAEGIHVQSIQCARGYQKPVTIPKSNLLKIFRVGEK